MLLPPKVTAPLSECNSSVEVQGQFTGSVVEIFVDGQPVATGNATWSRQVFPLPPNQSLPAGAKVTATQQVGQDKSDHSPPVIVQKKPAAIGQVAFVGPVYRCGRCIDTKGAVPGALVEASVGGVPRGADTAVTGLARFQLDPATGQSEVLSAIQTACGAAGGAANAPAAAEPPVDAKKILPVPTVASPLKECQPTVGLADLVIGATVTVARSSGPKHVFCTTRSSGYLIVAPPLKAGETVTAKQEFVTCELKSPTSKPRKVDSLEPIPPPALDKLCPGSLFFKVTGLLPGATVTFWESPSPDVYNELLSGQAPDASSFAFPVPSGLLKSGMKIHVTQGLCGKRSDWSKPRTVSEAATATVPPKMVKPLTECGGAVLVDAFNAIFVQVWSTMLDAPIGEAAGFAHNNAYFTVPVFPHFIEGDQIYATGKYCDGAELTSAKLTVGPAPERLPPPEIEKAVVNAKAVWVEKIIPGALVEVYVNNIWRGGDFSGSTGHWVSITGAAGLQLNDKVKARQRLCSAVSPFSKPVSALPKPPEAAFTASPTSGTAPLTVSFSNTSTGSIDSYEWDFDENGTIDSTAKNPGTFVYQQGGSYTATLTVTNAGGSDTATATIAVSDPPQEPPPDQEGFSEVAIYNCHVDHHAVNIWVNDTTAGTGWQELGTVDAQYDDGFCPVESPFVVTLDDSHIYEIVCVDVGGIACGQNDPTILGCRRLYIAVLGDGSGPTYVGQVV